MGGVPLSQRYLGLQARSADTYVDTSKPPLITLPAAYQSLAFEQRFSIYRPSLYIHVFNHRPEDEAEHQSRRAKVKEERVYLDLG